MSDQEFKGVVGGGGGGEGGEGGGGGGGGGGVVDRIQQGVGAVQTGMEVAGQVKDIAGTCFDFCCVTWVSCGL